jgi:radical SAM protein with 4Fe4S-binding SPASM domain
MKHRSEQQFLDSLSARAQKTRTPNKAMFELTYGCNLRCVHCFNPTHRALPQELTTAEVFSILDQLADMGVLILTFTGGELFVRPDVFDIFEQAKHLGFLLELISNATRITPALADRLQQLEFRCLYISMYGASKRTYERVTGVPGSFEAFLRGLECLAFRKMPVIVRMPVMTDNVEDVQDAKTLVEGYGVKFQFALDIYPKNNGDLAPLKHRLSPQEKVRLMERLIGYRSDGTMAPESCPLAAGEDFISCACGRTQFAITPYGEMNLCVGFPIPQYDLRKGSVREGWEILKQTVDHARPNEHDECPMCDLQRFCRQGRADAWLETGDMSVCLPHFKEWARLEKSVHESRKPRRVD